MYILGDHVRATYLPRILCVCVYCQGCGIRCCRRQRGYLLQAEACAWPHTMNAFTRYAIRNDLSPSRMVVGPIEGIGHVERATRGGILSTESRYSWTR